VIEFSVASRRLPALSPLEPEPKLPDTLYERRQAELRSRMSAVGLDALAVYSDREHFANSSYLVGFDPRFEEALVLLDEDGVTVLAGNESLSFVEDLPLAPRGVLCQSFSLPGQDRSIQSSVGDALAEAGLPRNARVGVVGWKPMPGGDVGGSRAVAAAQFVLVALDQHLAEPWRDATELLMGLDGARTLAEADQLALQEHRATRASRHVWLALEALAVGRSELEISQAMELTGLPLACHVMCTSGTDRVNGLRSPTDRRLAYGDRFSTAVGLLGGLCCRAGRLLGEADPELQPWAERFLAPYASAQRLWYESLRIGADTGEIAAAVVNALASHEIRPLLNPGHLVEMDEWMHSPFVPGAGRTLRSGTAVQCDIIPVTGDPGDVANCEDTLAVADEPLRAELAERYPAMWSRIVARRAFMADELAFELASEVLPFSDRQAALPAGLLSLEHLVCLGR